MKKRTMFAFVRGEPERFHRSRSRGKVLRKISRSFTILLRRLLFNRRFRRITYNRAVRGELAHCNCRKRAHAHSPVGIGVREIHAGEDTEEATLVFSSKGFVDLTSWFRSASKSAKLCIVNTSNGSNGATGSASSRSLRSVEDVSLISAVSVRMIRHLVRETLHFKAPTTTAKSLEYAKLASTSQSHPAGPVPKAFLANAFDKVKISVEENDVLRGVGV